MERPDPPDQPSTEATSPADSPVEADPDGLTCEILLFVATQSELEQLKAGAEAFGLRFEPREAGGWSYYSLGTIGSNRVRAVRTRMGPFFHQGSASQAILFRTAASAQSIIQIGMAFGIQRDPQEYGDVLVSEWIFPYDFRIVEQQGDDGYRADYSQTKRHNAKPALLRMFRREHASGRHAFPVRFGGILSGGSRVRSQSYLKQLLARVTGGDGPEGYVGGEMEGVGLLSSCEKKDPIWAVVKGICDFANQDQTGDAVAHREVPCRNAIRFVLSALIHADDPDDRPPHA